jgi:tetratricopeptide (TPR) repeat protein
LKEAAFSLVDNILILERHHPMKFLQDLSIRTKLILLSLIPLIGLLYYLQINIRQELKNRKTAQEVILDVEEIQEISKVIHEFQKERALTLTFLSGNNAQIKAEVLRQWEVTDKAIFALEKVLTIQNRTIRNYEMLDSLPFIRAKVNALRPVEQIDPFYRDFKSSLLDGVSEILRSSQNLSTIGNFLMKIVSSK